MASNVTFTRLARGDLPELVAAAGDDDPQAFVSFLAGNGSSVADYDGEAEIFDVLLPVLADEYGIDLETSENEITADLQEALETTIVLLTLEDREKYLEKLNPDHFSEEELQEAYEDFTEEEDAEAGELMLDAITALFQSLQEADTDHVIVLTLG